MKTRLLLFFLLLSLTNYAQPTLWQQKHRPQFHFSVPQKWMNDPNGMVFINGEYHLFYQHYPDSTVWGPMHWGHAVSKDLVTWKHLPIALYPDSLGYIFSGSAVVDVHNTSGLQQGSNPPVIAMYTYHQMEGERAGRNDFQTQGIAFSHDNGYTWHKYQHNPVIPNTRQIRDFRDPKVFWHEASKNWVMILAAGDRVHIYTSSNLIDWTLASEFGQGHGADGLPWECPDLFEMAVDGHPSNKKWVMLVSLGKGGPNGGSATQYFVGNFDGKTFTNDSPPTTVKWLDYGTDNYAGVTWSNAPANRHLLIGWMSNWQYAQQVPTTTWRSAMTLPQELALRHTSKGMLLAAKPVKEIQKLRQKATPLKVGRNTLSSSLQEVEISIDLKKTTTNEVVITFSNELNQKVVIGFDKAANEFYLDRRQSGETNFSEHFASLQKAPRLGEGNLLNLTLWLDHSSLELSADNGLTRITALHFPAKPYKWLWLKGNGGNISLKKGMSYSLKSIHK